MSAALPWILFHLLVAVILALDLGVFNKKAHTPTFKQALFFTGLWVTLALAFGAGVHTYKGTEAGQSFIAAYLLELSLSVDNLFVFIIIFSFLKIPEAAQHRVLYWGILGAVFLRALCIIGGIALVSKFTWLFYIFGLLLLFTSYKLVFGDDERVDPSESKIIKYLGKIVPLTHEFNGDRFFTLINGKRFATPLFSALVFIECSDVVFALDSIPAVLGVTSDPFVAYTSNIFAILGLRSMYFFVAKVISYFRFLNYGLAMILAFVGVKLMGHDHFHIPTNISLSVVAGILFFTILLSVFFPKKAHTH